MIEVVAKEKINTLHGKGKARKLIYEDQHGYFIKHMGSFESVAVESNGEWYTVETDGNIYNYRLNKYK